MPGYKYKNMNMYDASDEGEGDGQTGENGGSRLRQKARNMIGATGSRHINQRRRASLASGTPLPLSLVHNLEQVAEGDESRMGAVARRRVVDTSDLRTCAILQSRLKELKTYPE
ncbi:uncharacterized protein LOC131939021 [Physella acuta]|uniref:uncharacterized protein LOC131939021 n=1 Tax=Physella acuta TaxID=109671 RepID=UPI0027DCB300|nr:uncharacterized protein LOC131939021 [Physella acuta]